MDITSTQVMKTKISSSKAWGVAALGQELALRGLVYGVRVKHAVVEAFGQKLAVGGLVDCVCVEHAVVEAFGQELAVGGLVDCVCVEHAVLKVPNRWGLRFEGRRF